MTTEEQPIVNVIQLSDNIRVERWRMIGTNFVYHWALEPDVPVKDEWHAHGTIQYDDDKKVWGTVASRNPPPHLAALPYGIERFDLFGAWDKACELESYHYILLAYPELMDRTYEQDIGRIIVYDPELAELVSPRIG